MTETDEQLYSRFLLKNSNDDLKELLERHREGLTMFLFGLVHDIDDAEELMLDAYAVAASGTSAFSGKSSFKTWIFGIGRNLALKHLRKHRYQSGSLDSDELNEVRSPEELSPEMELIKEERRQKLYAAMEKLDEDYREVLYLIYFENMSCEEAAGVMKKTRKQIYNLSARGKQALKNELYRMGFEYEEL